ncbi:MAG: GNAT family N-acetyltransferase [Bacteroidetes bacterium]|nr:GNAT family N-acetyltransferase [Bacteroidota bacterium]
MNFVTRSAHTEDEENIYQLYKQVAAQSVGLARQEDEITREYISTQLQKSIQNGISLVIENPENVNELVAEIHCSKPEPRVFRHIFSDLTIAVHPQFQGKGLGRLLFTTFLKCIEENRPDILRVELITRESNSKAITFYKSIGFKVEGKLEQRINNTNNNLEADIPMAWFNCNYIKTQ